MDAPDTDEIRATSQTILVVDDEPSVLSAVRAVLNSHGYEVVTAANGQEALQQLESVGAQFVLCDLMMPVLDGIGFLKALREQGGEHTVIIMSAYGTVDLALEAIRLGAYDYIAKPFSADELILTLKKAEERERLRLENAALRAQVSRRYSFSSIISKNPAMLDIFETIKKIGDYKTTILLQGESGTGKELIARAIHVNSTRKNKPFIPINCSAIPENLLESELFGHKKGAFTDATRDKRGLFEEANGGTLLLDEVGELPLHLQVKLLRVLQENEIRPVGDSRIIPIDVRIVAATLRDLEQDVLDGRFRDDLFYRLDVVSIRVPPLRERREDIPLLVNYFLKRNRDKLGLNVFGITKDAMGVLMEHTWPGNIRELENCIERSMILTEGPEITVESLPQNVLPAATAPKPVAALDGDSLSIKVHSRNIEEALIRRALERTRGNRTHAAKLLEISHRTLLYKLKEYEIDIPPEAGAGSNEDAPED